MNKIETERLILRTFCDDDYIDVFDYLHEPLSPCFYSMKIDNLKDAKRVIEKRINNHLHLAIVLKEENKVIGELEGHPESSFPDDDHRVLDTYSLCWMLNKDYFSKGYAYEAAYAFINYLFHDLNARRIYAYVEDYNSSSLKLCQKLGMRKEGEFREFVSFENNEDGSPHYVNTFQYAILKKEWNICE